MGREGFVRADEKLVYGKLLIVAVNEEFGIVINLDFFSNTEEE